MSELFGYHLPHDTGWIVSVPRYLSKLSTHVTSLTTLDVHAIAYTTYLANANPSLDDDIRYEMAYLLAWFYEYDPQEIRTSRCIAFETNELVIGTGEIIPKQTHGGQIITEQLRMQLDEDCFETDEEFVERVNDKVKSTFALKMEDVYDEYDVDKAIFKTYLRYGPTKEFKSFLRRSFLREEFVDDAQAVVMAFKQANSESTHPGKADSLEYFRDRLKIDSSLRQCTSLFVTTYNSMSTLLSESKEEQATELVEAIEHDATLAEGLHSKEEIMEATPVTVIHLNAKSKLLDYVSATFLLTMLGYKVPLSSSSSLEASLSWRHYVIIKDMRGRFKTQMFYGHAAYFFLQGLRAKYLTSVERKLDYVIPIK